MGPGGPPDAAGERLRLERRPLVVLDQITEGVVVADEAGRVTYLNEAARRLHGRAELGVAVDRFAEVYGLRNLAGEPLAGAATPLARAFHNGARTEHATWRIERPDGSHVIVSGSATPLAGEDGERLGAVLVVQDITAQQRLLHELEVERQRLREIIMRAPAFIAVLRGPDHVFELANPPYLRLVGRRDIIGKPVREALPEVEGQGYFELLDQVARTGEPFIGTEMPLVLQPEPDAPPTERFVTFIYLPLRDVDGSISGLLAHGVDATDQVRARQRIEELYHEAEAASRAKSEFLSVMSHELRTPLTAVIGYADLLLAGMEGTLDDRQTTQVERIKASSWHLVRIIDEILAYTRTESARERVARAPVALQAIVAEATAEILPLAHAKGIEVRWQLPREAMMLETDALKVRQILTNLLANAVKFTASGEIVVSLRSEPAQVVIAVQDTGSGIAPEHLERIFEPFWQVEQSTTRSVGGTGLGLTISRRLASLLGGELDVESEPGVGSTFRLRLPTTEPLAGTLAAALSLRSGIERRGRGVARLGRTLLRHVDAILDRLVARLRTDAGVPRAARLERADLVDHGTTFLTDIAQGLIALEDSDEDPLTLLQDGTEIQRVISQLHGAQRARLGWSEAALRREYEILSEEVTAALRDLAEENGPVDASIAQRIVTSLLERAQTISLAGFRDARRGT